MKAKDIGSLALKVLAAGAIAVATLTDPVDTKPKIKCGFYEVDRMPGPADFVPENFREVPCDEGKYHPVNPDYQGQ